MDLREETRSLEQIRDDMKSLAYTEKAEAQSGYSAQALQRVVNVITDIQGPAAG